MSCFYSSHFKVILALEPKEIVDKAHSVLEQADTATDGALWMGSVFQV